MIETAITIPVLFLLLLSFLLAMVVAQAYVDLDTATSLAAASAVSAPAGSDSQSRGYAMQTYSGTLLGTSYLTPGALDGCGGYTAGGNVTCTGHATLFLSRTPMAILKPFDSDWRLDIQATATGYSSAYRST